MYSILEKSESINVMNRFRSFKIVEIQFDIYIFINSSTDLSLLLLL